MKLIVGLGNPGKRYQHNRHNAGFMVIAALKTKRLPSEVVVKKTNVMMNDSGRAIKEMVKRYQVQMNNLYVIHDDLDIALAEYKIQKSKGPKDHKGLLSVYQALETKNFWHVRVGVENRDPKNRVSGEEYVLQDFDQSERTRFLEVLPKVIDSLLKKIYEES